MPYPSRIMLMLAANNVRPLFMPFVYVVSRMMATGPGNNTILASKIDVRYKKMHAIAYLSWYTMTKRLQYKKEVQKPTTKGQEGTERTKVTSACLSPGKSKDIDMRKICPHAAA